MDVATLVARQERGEPLDFLFFWGHTPGKDGALGSFCLSQWYPAGLHLLGFALMDARDGLAGAARSR